MLKDFLLTFVLPIIILIVFITTSIAGIFWIGSCKQAGVYNRLHNTTFTCSDFFWAADQINIQTQTIKLE